MRSLARRAFLITISSLIFLASGEAALRIIYRDAGRRTLGAPGGGRFVHEMMEDDRRGRLEYGPRTPGVPRILILGDSITWGQGVRDWRDTWPERLATALEAAGTPHEMAVLAGAGREIPDHVVELDAWAEDIQPDVVIYQWYLNDLETLGTRPRVRRGWQRHGAHATLMRSSYLYYFLDDRLSKLLPGADRSYVQYILEDFVPGTLEWAEFERHFHHFAVRAAELAPRRLLVLYPVVPFRSTSPVKPVHDRLHGMAGPHRLGMPVTAWFRAAGTMLVRDPDRPGQNVLRAAATHEGVVLETREYYFPSGTTTIILDVRADAVPLGTRLGSLELVEPESGERLLATEVIGHDADGVWQQLQVPVTLAGERGRLARLRLRSAVGAALSVSLMEIPVDYGLEVLDLTDPLNRFDTHASIFDAHPNAAAHRVIADAVLAALRTPPAGR